MKKNRHRRVKRKNRQLLIMCLVVIGIVLIIILNKNKNQKTLQKTMETAMSINISNEESQNKIDNEEKLKPEISSKTTDWNLVLVNKKNKIPDNYEFEISSIDSKNKVDNRIKSAITEMISDAKKEGLQPFICSSYRSSEDQQRLFDNKVNKYKKQGYTKENAEIEASRWVAVPRTSEHEIGLSLDIVSKSYQVLDEKQESTKVQKWLIEHCTDYGFVLRYPTNKKDITMINYEPWHYRYVGIENAKFMKEKDFCLEEYIEYLKQYE